MKNLERVTNRLKADEASIRKHEKPGKLLIQKKKNLKFSTREIYFRIEKSKK